jgi:hypothetical protein
MTSREVNSYIGQRTGLGSDSRYWRFGHLLDGHMAALQMAEYSALDVP